MKIVNFHKHTEPLDCGWKDGRKQIASFDIEFSVGGMYLLWVGWSVRKFKDRNFLQAPHNSKKTSFRKGPTVLIKGQDPTIVLQMIRELVFKEHGIEIAAPKKPDPKPESNPVPNEKPKEPANKKKVST